MPKPIVVIQRDAGASEKDVAALRKAGILVLRVDGDPSLVRVLDTDSIVADGFVFRAMLDMMQHMGDGYTKSAEHKSFFTDSLIKYAQLQIAMREKNEAPPTPEPS